MVDAARFPDAPSTDIKSVEESGHASEIYNMLCSGLSPARVSNLIDRRYQIKLSTVDIRKYFEQIPAAHILPPSLIRKRFQALDLEVDAVGEMARLLKLQEERLSAILLVEELGSDDKASSGPDPRVDKQINVYWRMLERYITFRQSLGELPSEPLKIANLNTADDEGRLPSVRQMLIQKTQTRLTTTQTQMLAMTGGQPLSSEEKPALPPVPSPKQLAQGGPVVEVDFDEAKSS